MVPKSVDEAARLRKILSRNYLFSELATGQLDNVVEVQGNALESMALTCWLGHETAQVQRERGCHSAR